MHACIHTYMPFAKLSFKSCFPGIPGFVVMTVFRYRQFSDTVSRGYDNV